MDGTQKQVVTANDGFAYEFFKGIKKNTSTSISFTDVASVELFLTKFNGAVNAAGKGLHTVYLLLPLNKRKQPRQQLVNALLSGEIWCYQQRVKQLPISSPASTPSRSSSVQNEPKAPGGRSKTQVQTQDQHASEPVAQSIDHQDTVLCGDPVAMSSGEEVLQLVDVHLQGHVALCWQRIYRSSCSHLDLGLGLGWRSNFHYSLEEDFGEQPCWQFTDALGQVFRFPYVAVGAKSIQVKSGMVLRHQSDDITISHADGKTLYFSKTQQTWLLTKLSEGVDRAFLLSYSAAHRLIGVAVNRSQRIYLRYDLKGHLLEVCSSRAQDAQIYANYGYDDKRRLIRASNRFAQQEHYRYQQGLLIQRTRASGFRHYFRWDGSDQRARCIEQWGDNQHYHYRFEYQPEQGISRSFDSYNNCWTYLHNAQGQLLKKIAPDGATWRFEYDEFQRKISQTEPNGTTTCFHYNSAGQLVAELHPNQSLTCYSYNRLGFVNQIDYADGSSLKREYNSLGLLTQEIDVQGVVTQYRYDAHSRLINKSAGNQPAQLFWWNEQGLLSAKQVGDALTRYSYNAIGECNGEVNAYGWVSQYVRNAQGQLIEVVHYHQDQPQHTRCQRYAYDQAGRLSARTSPLGHTTNFEYQGLSQPSKQINPDGSWLAFSYDKERNLTAIERSDGQRYQLEYDSCERIRQTIGFDGREQAYQYNLAGQLIQLVENSERLVQLKRNSLGQVIEQRSTANGMTLINDFAYNLQGKLSQANNSARKIRFNYFANGQLQEHWQDDWHIRHQLNQQGLRSQTRLPDSSMLRYRYDEHGRLSELTLNGQALISRQFNASGSELNRELSASHQQHNHYDPQGRLLKQEWQGDTLNLARDYRFDDGDQLLGVNDSELGAQNYSYDPLSQLTKATSHSGDNQAFSLDSFANPKQGELAGDKLLMFNERSYRYDRYGNQVLASQSKVRQQRVFNGLNQLVRLSEGGKHAEYHYDALGRRSRKITSSGTTDYLWEGQQLIGEHRQGQFTWYVYEPNSHRPLVMIKQGQVYHYHLDHIGTPIRLSDEQGNIVWQAHYQAYGAIEQLSVNQIDNPLRFQGQYFDDESGLHYNHHRYYCPQQGRYIQQDPIELLGGLNLYQYTPSPTNWVDPLGLCKEDGVLINTAYFVGGITKFWGESTQAAIEAIVADPINVAYDAVYTIVDTAYYPIDYVTRPFGFTTGAVERTMHRVNMGVDGVEKFADEVSLNWAKGDWQNLGANVAAVGMTLNPKALVKGRATSLLDTAGDAVTVAKKTGKGRLSDFAHRSVKSRTPDSFANEFSSLNHQKAAAGEYNAHALLVEKGYKPLGNTDGKYSPGKQGIDGIYQHPNPPPDFVITEAKYGKSRLGKTSDGKQMSDKWINKKRLKEAGLSRKEQKKIFDSIKKGDGKVEKLLIRNKTDGSLVAKKLDDKANIISQGLSL